ncbi:MAG: DUF2147 domain-containing protein [Pseudomonadota bacterium]
MLQARTRIITAFILLPTVGATAFAESVDPFLAIEGDWATQGYGAVVRMTSCADAPNELCGTMVWAWEPNDLKPGSLGSLMFEGAAFEDGKWTGGRLRNPEDGRAYRGSITQVDANRLELRGCAARVFCQSQTWLRLESLPHMATKPR